MKTWRLRGEQNPFSRLATGLLMLGFVFSSVATARAHASLPGYLELQETSAGTFDLVWKVPTAEGPPPAIYPSFPDNCKLHKGLTAEQTAGAIVERGVLQCGSKGLFEATIEITGLEITILDVLVRITFADGTIVQHVLKPLEPLFVVPKAGKSTFDLSGYVSLGIRHILYGIDHLLFVLELLLIVRGSAMLLKTISAFTLAHTTTLGLAVFGVVHVSPGPVEAVIALSIVFLAAEIAHHYQGGDGTLAYRQPWIVAFAFGLLHGFGFAGGLSSLGIPRTDIPQALLFFNLGIEAGQLAFVGLLVSVAAALKRLQIRPPLWTRLCPAYLIGSAGSFWLIQRCASIF
jgi:hypothetical protein